MKKYLIILGFLVTVASDLSAQETKIPKKQVPEAVMKAFKDSYPKAKIRGTNKENKHGMLYYEIESTDGKMKRDLLYSPAGVVVEKEEIIPASSLPDAVKKAFAEQHPKAKITSVEKNTQDQTITYELTAKLGAKAFEAVYSNEGMPIKSVD